MISIPNMRKSVVGLHILLEMAVITWPRASKKKRWVKTDVLTSMTILAVMTARKAIMFNTRRPFRMM
jgi:hypothetical protein